MRLGLGGMEAKRQGFLGLIHLGVCVNDILEDRTYRWRWPLRPEYSFQPGCARVSKRKVLC